MNYIQEYCLLLYQKSTSVTMVFNTKKKNKLLFVVNYRKFSGFAGHRGIKILNKLYIIISQVLGYLVIGMSCQSSL